MKYILVILILSITQKNIAQKNLYEIEYLFIANNDSTVQGIDELFYDSSKKNLLYKNGKTEIASTNSISNNEGVVIDVMMKNKNLDFIYIDFNENLLFNQLTPIQNTYITSESIPIFNWIITEETKISNKIQLTKANTHFRGRNYEVWFSYEHPIPVGPWKFNGLPGLIFEVNDLSEHQNYNWKLKKFKSKKGIIPFNNPLDRNLINIKDLKNKLFEEYIEYDNILTSKIDLDLPPSSKDDILLDFENFQQQHIEKKIRMGRINHNLKTIFKFYS